MLKLLKKNNFICGILVILSGCANLISWAFGNVRTLAGSSHYIPMAPNSAFIFIIIGTCLVVSALEFKERVQSWIFRSLSGVVFFFSGFLLADYFFHLNTHVDGWIFASNGIIEAIPVGKMSPITAFAFVLFGIIFLALSFQKKRLASIINVLLLLISIVLLIGYAFGAPFLYGSAIIPVALPTAISFLFVSFGIIYTIGPGIWPVSLLMGQSSYSVLMRWILPSILSFLFFSDVLSYRIAKSTGIHEATFSALTTLTAIILVPFLVHLLSKNIGGELDKANAESQRNHSLLQDRLKEVEKNRLCLQSLLHLLQYKTESVQAWLDHAQEEAIKLTESKIGYIYFYDETARLFTLNTWSKGVMKECSVVNPQTQYELDKTGIWGEVVRQRKPIMVNNFSAPNPQKKGYPEGHAKLFNFLSVPVFSHGQIVAVIGVANKEKDYDEQDVLQLSLLLNSVWSEFEQKRSEQIIRDREKEKVEMQAQLIHSSKLASIGTLAAGVAHEINNPLAIILGHAERMKTKFSHHLEQDDFISIQKIHDATMRIANIVNGLRIYARQDSENIEDVDMHLCIKETLSILQGMYEKENIKIETHLNAQHSFLHANMGKLHQVVMNLVGNAKDALSGRCNPTITIATSDQNDSLVITVSDNGIGIPKHLIAQIFDPFFTTKAPGKGTGLGLSISHTIIEDFGGSISVVSEENVGTTFKVIFPRGQKSRAVDEKSSSLEADCRFSGSVLIVDDEADMREILNTYLTSMGLDVAEAENGEDAYQMILKQNFDYVFTDLQMPKMHGDELLSKVKSDNLARKTKFFIITGGILSELTPERSALLKKHADGHIDKPFQKSDLIKALKLSARKI